MSSSPQPDDTFADNSLIITTLTTETTDVAKALLDKSNLSDKSNLLDKNKLFDKSNLCDNNKLPDTNFADSKLADERPANSNTNPDLTSPKLTNTLGDKHVIQDTQVQDTHSCSR